MDKQIIESIETEHMMLLLKPKHRTIVALIYAGFSHKEAAAIVGLTRAAVGIIYKQAINTLRRYYAST